jgi:hypothetical protein
MFATTIILCVRLYGRLEKFALGTLVLLLLLTQARAAPTVPRPLSKEDQDRVDRAIDRGVAYLKSVQLKAGDFSGKIPGGHFVGECALPAYALLEAGVPANDPVIRKAAVYLRPRVPLTRQTYDLALAILFFDRLGDPKDKVLIQMCALRLIAGQHRTGGWSYGCPVLDDQNAQDLLDTLAKLNKRRTEKTPTRAQALEGMTVPLALQGLTVFQSGAQLAQQMRNLATTDPKIMGLTDNSNTQFGLLGLWAARRHDVAVEPALEIAVEHFERTQVFPSGFWLYGKLGDYGHPSRDSMACVGLIALAIGRGLKIPTPGSPAPDQKDVHVLRGLAYLSRQMFPPRGTMKKRAAPQEVYFLWSLERVGMLFNLPDIAGKDWYRWGAESLVTNQIRDGSWADIAQERSVPKCAYGRTLCTAFALLFLKRSHPMKDLTPKLPFTAKELNEGIARLKRRDIFPEMQGITTRPGSRPGTAPRGGTTTKPTPSKNKSP